MRVQEDTSFPEFQFLRKANSVSVSSVEIEENEVVASKASLVKGDDAYGADSTHRRGTDRIFEAHENLNNQLTGIAYAESPMEASDKGLEIVEDIQDSQNSLRAAQVEGINLLVDLNQKEGASRCITQSFEEYRQRREAYHGEDYVISSGE
ncbi:hypothetical protein RHMOL_Rhmol10G0104100 [Rhododendron molle]|uniref:Uncharacterized protein n=1 Tax=Rhododendron molle TaxID=49168 RepID=A0ACC0M1Y6_RHOML|nr:hypothetical protein RHMOL_Rhmol10G0104100 [Rhododendron molle]